MNDPQRVGIYHTSDMDLVRSIMTTPEIWSQAVEEGTRIDRFYPIQDDLCVWLLVKLKSEIIGVMLVNHDTSCSINIHPVLFSKYKRYGRDMMKSFFAWVDSMPGYVTKVNCSIPDHLKIVQNFAVKVGFKQEGTNRASFFFNGKAQDQTRFGLTREEIKRLLWVE